MYVVKKTCSSACTPLSPQKNRENQSQSWEENGESRKNTRDGESESKRWRVRVGGRLEMERVDVENHAGDGFGPEGAEQGD